MLEEVETQQDQRWYQKYQVKVQDLWEWFCGNSSMEDTFQANSVCRKNVLSTSLEHVGFLKCTLYEALLYYIALIESGVGIDGPSVKVWQCRAMTEK